MRRTLIQALLILDYIMDHDSSFEQVGIIVNVNGALFSDYTYTSSFKGHSSNYFQESAKKRLCAIGKDKDIFVNITTDMEGKRIVTFMQY